MGRYGKNMRDCCDSNAQKGTPHISGCPNTPEKQLLEELLADVSAATKADAYLDLKVYRQLLYKPDAELMDPPSYFDSYNGAMKLIGPETPRRIEFGTNAPDDCWAYVHLDDDTVGNAEACASEPLAIVAAFIIAKAARLDVQEQEEVA